jgi:hypothetical protein
MRNLRSSSRRFLFHFIRAGIFPGMSDGTLIDLSHTVEHGMITYKGLPAPIICDYLSREASRAKYAPGTEFHIGKIEMVANTGTYLDSPFHRYPDGDDLSQLNWSRWPISIASSSALRSGAAAPSIACRSRSNHSGGKRSSSTPAGTRIGALINISKTIRT